MLDAYHGLGTRAVLERLEARGQVARATHMPGEGRHWVLTGAGRDEAERTLAALGGEGRGEGRGEEGEGPEEGRGEAR